jgi:hypothetical protein
MQIRSCIWIYNPNHLIYNIIIILYKRKKTNVIMKIK